MEQLYLCAHCGEENEIQIDARNGDRQVLSAVCSDCGAANRIVAQYNFHTSEFDLVVEQESAG